MKTLRIWSKCKKHSFVTHRLVDFLICGTQRGGTTALYSYLKEHPLICMATKKEVHFFDDESKFKTGKPDYSLYHSNFALSSENQFLGEATPIYMYWHDAPRRIWQYNRNLKIIVLLRNPIDRAYSHWNMERSRNAESLPFWEALQRENERCREALPFQHRVYSYVDRGFYLEQLRRIWRFFPRRNVLVLKSEYLKHNPYEAVSKVCEFIGVDNIKNVKPRELNRFPYLSKMGRREKEYLESVFEYEIRNIERTLGWDCSDWL